jgi:hypothetical protein
MRVYQITGRNKAAAIAIGAATLIVGGAMLAVGLALFAGLAIIRRVTRRPGVRTLDPAQEVFPPASTDVTRRIRGDD